MNLYEIQAAGGITITPDQLSPEGRAEIVAAIDKAKDILASHPLYSWIENGQVVTPTPENPGLELIEDVLVDVFKVPPADLHLVSPSLYAQAKAYAAAWLDSRDE